VSQYLGHSGRRAWANCACVPGRWLRHAQCAKLGLLFVGPQAPEPITALAAAGNWTFAATGHDILMYNRAKLVRSDSTAHTTQATPG